jgi:hypothetical protein
MKLVIAALAGLLAVAGAGTSANAAPAFGSSKFALSGETLVQKTHGLHRTCQKGRGGWHRSYRWSRVSCTPAWRLQQHRNYKNRWSKKHRWSRYR